MTKKEKYSYLGLKEGMRVRVYTHEWEGVEGDVARMMDNGNVTVSLDEWQYSDHDDEETNVIDAHPKQLEIISRIALPPDQL